MSYEEHSKDNNNSCMDSMNKELMADNLDNVFRKEAFEKIKELMSNKNPVFSAPAFKGEGHLLPGPCLFSHCLAKFTSQVLPTLSISQALNASYKS